MKQSKKWMLVALALLAMVALPLVGCKNDSVSEPVSGTETPPKTPSNVDSLINELSGEGPYTLVATGNWSADDLSTLAEKLKDWSKKVNLDLSKVSGLTKIGGNAFRKCSSLRSITIPASVKTIEHHAFQGCENLAEVTFGEGSKLETIPDGAFFRCSLTSITIPASVTTIGDNAFNGCSSLKSVTIPASVTTIRGGAFRECRSLDTVTMEATNPPGLSPSVFENTASNLQILVPKGSETKYKAATNWKDYVAKIKAK